MLYIFKSQAAADLIMLEANGRKMLEIIGKDPRAPGIVTVAQMALAVAALEQAVAEDEARRANASQTGDDEADDASAAPKRDPVSLRQRATPLIELLRRCARENSDIVWGV